MRLTLSGSCTTSKPPTSAVPEVGSSIPVSILIVVLLPAPFGPSKPTSWPLGISRLISFTATCGPNSLVRLCRLIMAGLFAIKDQMIDRKPIVFAGHHQHKQQDRQTPNHVRVKFIKRFAQQVSKGHNRQHKSQGDQRVAGAQADNYQRPSDHFDEGNSDAGGP